MVMSKLRSARISPLLPQGKTPEPASAATWGHSARARKPKPTSARAMLRGGVRSLDGSRVLARSRMESRAGFSRRHSASSSIPNQGTASSTRVGCPILARFGLGWETANYSPPSSFNCSAAAPRPPIPAPNIENG